MPSNVAVRDNSCSVFFSQIIVIIKHILENKLGRKDCFQMSGIDAMILSFVRSVLVYLLPCCLFFGMKQEHSILIYLVQVSIDAL